MFAGFGDFAFYRIEISTAHLVAGFGRIVDLQAAGHPGRSGRRRRPACDAEERASAHMNEDHADALRLYATNLYGAPDGDWRCAGFDPEGLELQNGRSARGCRSRNG